jgi:hypothetical protein
LQLVQVVLQQRLDKFQTNQFGFGYGDLMINENEKFFFKSDETNRNRTEDAIISWTWKKYLDMNGSDPTVLLQLPMTKV